MLTIFGSHIEADRIGPVRQACPLCQPPGQLVLNREITTFTMMNLQVLRIRTQLVLRCLDPACGAMAVVSPAEAKHLLIPQ